MAKIYKYFVVSSEFIMTDMYLRVTHPVSFHATLYFLSRLELIDGVGPSIFICTKN